MQTSILGAHNVSKAYSGRPALRNVTVELQTGEVLGLVGENGAGKSTLLNILSGVTQADSGIVLVNGVATVVRSYHDANKVGIFRVFQEGALIPNLRVYQNLLLSHEDHFNRAGVYLDDGATKAAARRIMDSVGLDLDINQWVQDLPLSQRQAIEIARATALSSLLGIERPVILLDEPTTALDVREVQVTIDLIRRLKGRAAFVLVSHRLEEILEVSNRIVVLKDGQVVSEMPVAEASPALLHRLMVGRDLMQSATMVRQPVDDKIQPILAAHDISVPGSLHNLSLQVRAGEILGIGGLEGSGKSDVGRAIVGATKLSSGIVEIEGTTVAPNLRRMIDHGVVYLPGDRQLEGLILNASIVSNITLLSIHDRFSSWLGILRLRSERTVARHWMEQLHIVAPGIHTHVETLSGGQQQKVLFAKYLSREPRILIMENPTRGVDINTKLQIYQLIASLTLRGSAIILISDDLPELITLSDRIMILAHGQVVDTVDSAEGARPPEHDLVRLMLMSPAGDMSMSGAASVIANLHSTPGATQ